MGVRDSFSVLEPKVVIVERNEPFRVEDNLPPINHERTFGRGLDLFPMNHERHVRIENLPFLSRLMLMPHMGINPTGEIELNAERRRTDARRNYFGSG